MRIRESAGIFGAYFEGENMDNNRIIDIDDFYNRCEREKITPFAATSSLDNKDVILLTDDIEELFKICKLNRINTIFYYYGYPDISNYRIDIDKLIEELRKRYERKLDIAMFSLQYISKDYFADVLQNLVSKMQMRAEQQNQRIVGINEDEPDYFQAFACLNGYKVAVFLNVGWDEEDDESEPLMIASKFHNDFLNELDQKLQERISKATDENRIIKEKKEKEYQSALKEIEEFLKTDDKIMECKFKNARQTYADQLRMEWGEKIGQTILQKDVKGIVEKVYTQRKSI